MVEFEQKMQAFGLLAIRLAIHAFVMGTNP